MQQTNNFEKILKSVISENDLLTLSLDDANDEFSKLCRAFIIQFYEKNLDNKKSLSLLSSEKNNPVLKLFNNFFNENKIKTPKNFSTKSDKHIWEIFCPEAFEASIKPEEVKDKILKKRKLIKINENQNFLKNPVKEILFLSNVLITTPSDFLSTNIPLEIKDELKNFKNVKQRFWYDHPIQLDALNYENEIIYGLENLDRAIAFEVKRGNINNTDKINLILSVSVTHIGLENIALKYIKTIIKKHLNLKFINVYLFDEYVCNNINSILFSEGKDTENIMGVNGNYGRHYTFLKYILLIWNKIVDKDVRYSFKIDLDQVFDQEILLKTTGFSIFEIFKNQKNWGGTAIDYEGKKVDLGLLAGALVNKADISKSLFTPDVNRPINNDLLKNPSSKRIFCPEWPQSLSTEAELMYRLDNIQRIHVTGGTTGITVDSLVKWAPFTPSFVNRAEDQAFVISSIKEAQYLSHCHAKDLVMRHDKHAFAQKSIEMSKFGKEIGNLERILIFSYYMQIHDLGFEILKKHLWPFTSSFLTQYPELLSGLIFLIDGSHNGKDYVSLGSQRLFDTQIFCKTKLEKQYNIEKLYWREFVNRVEKFNDYNGKLTTIILNTKV